MQTPQPPFILWLNEEDRRSTIQKEYFTDKGVELTGRDKVTQVAAKAGELWGVMTDEEKEPYRRAAMEYRARWRELREIQFETEETTPGWSKAIPGSYIKNYVVGTPRKGYATLEEAKVHAARLGPAKCGGITQNGPDHPKYPNRYTLRRPGKGARPQPEKAIRENPHCKDEVSWEFRGVPAMIAEVPENSDGWVNLPGSAQQEYPVLSSQDFLNQSVEPPARGPSPTSQMVTGAVGNALGVAADLAKRSAQAFKEQLGKAHQMITAQKREMKTMGEDLEKLDGHMKEMSSELEFLRAKVSLDEQREHWIKENDWMSPEEYERKLLDAGKKSPEEVSKVAEQYFKQKPLPKRFRNEPEQVEESEEEDDLTLHLDVEEFNETEYLVDPSTGDVYDYSSYMDAEPGELLLVGKLVDGKLVAK